MEYLIDMYYDAWINRNFPRIFILSILFGGGIILVAMLFYFLICGGFCL